METYRKLLDDVIEGLREKKDFSSRWCEHYTVDCDKLLKEYADGKTVDCGHNCEYCDKFRWVIDRARNYSEKLNIPIEEIIQSWEADRNYWYMNYYQESNQPKIESKKVRVFDTYEEFKSAIGEMKFRCPSCGKVTTNPYECKSCSWKIYGFFRGMGKEVFVYVKDKMKGEYIFMPILWEKI